MLIDAVLCQKKVKGYIRVDTEPSAGEKVKVQDISGPVV